MDDCVKSIYAILSSYTPCCLQLQHPSPWVYVFMPLPMHAGMLDGQSVYIRSLTVSEHTYSAVSY